MFSSFQNTNEVKHDVALDFSPEQAGGSASRDGSASGWISKRDGDAERKGRKLENRKHFTEKMSQMSPTTKGIQVEAARPSRRKRYFLPTFVI